MIITIFERTESRTLRAIELLQADSHQGKIASETTTFGLMYPSVPSHTQICLDIPVLRLVGLRQVTIYEIIPIK